MSLSFQVIFISLSILIRTLWSRLEISLGVFSFISLWWPKQFMLPIIVLVCKIRFPLQNYLQQLLISHRLFNQIFEVLKLAFLLLLFKAIQTKLQLTIGMHLLLLVRYILLINNERHQALTHGLILLGIQALRLPIIDAQSIKDILQPGSSLLRICLIVNLIHISLICASWLNRVC